MRNEINLILNSLPEGDIKDALQRIFEDYMNTKREVDRLSKKIGRNGAGVTNG